MAEKLKRLRRRNIVIFSILLALIMFLTTGYFFARETPRYSLYWFKRAILKHDAEGALKYIDIDSILDNMVKDMSGEEDGERVHSKTRPENSSKNIGRDVVIQNLPAIKEQLREQLKSAIISYNDRTALDNLKKASVFGLRITRENDTALVNIRGKDMMAFKMVKAPEGHWRIVALNLKELASP